MTSVKEHGINISFATLASLIPVFAMTWFLIKPAVVKAVGDELQEQVQRSVAKEVKPIGTALGIILQNNAANIERQIAVMEFRRDFPPDGDWTNNDARQLAQLRLDLKSAEAAKVALTKEPDSNI
ncbi:hypothetical protein LCGC14_1101260 [marine sediment metagenome]|uniref:Uncharacterized protein n=1 Tax=marine sediment metagenome TaxID=412755 RepID=A0A0F9MDX4_9ZZZZ